MIDYNIDALFTAGNFSKGLIFGSKQLFDPKRKKQNFSATASAEKSSRNETNKH